ncbi:MAG TPA: hypothetical protein DIW31_00045 [Bacteroidales bacterium]|nr:hypothetical protein [Bacteroidales bacterium]
MKYFYVLLLSIFSLQALKAQDSIPSDVLESIKLDDLKRITYKLSSPEMEGRGLKTRGIIKASEYIANNFQSYNVGFLPKLDGYYQKVDFFTYHLEKPLFKIGKMLCSENVNYLGNSSSIANRRDFDILVTNNISPDYIKSIDIDDKTILILTKDIFFEKASLYDVLIKKGCRGVLLCNPYDKNQFNKLSKIYSAKDLEKRNKLKESFSGSVAKTDSLIKNLKYKNFYISTVVLHPRVVSNLMNTSLKRIVRQLESNVLDSNLIRTYPLAISIRRDFVKNLDVSNNVLGYIEGSEYPNEVVVISAHYDHLGIEGNRIMYGADDNASGVAAVIEIAEAYSKAIEKGFKPKRSIIFAAFSGEESGLWGSRIFVNRADSLDIKPVLNLNMDMIGRGEDSHIEKNRKIKKVYAITLKRDSLLTKQIKTNTLGSDSLFVDYTSTDIYSSDQASFIANKIPAVMFFRGLHSDYHSERDTPEKLDYKTMERIARLVFRVSWKYVR